MDEIKWHDLDFCKIKKQILQQGWPRLLLFDQALQDWVPPLGFEGIKSETPHPQHPQLQGVGKHLLLCIPPKHPLQLPLPPPVVHRFYADRTRIEKPDYKIYLSAEAWRSRYIFWRTFPFIFISNEEKQYNHFIFNEEEQYNRTGIQRDRISK